ncbi:MAG: acyltransferase family protein [Candidatus Sumerlaeia bacterium]|nr:acyltransferase family protein [Candidatus Sumerlaeia bacterium]
MTHPPFSIMTPPHSTLSYRPEIDGLRAVAVLAVVAFHYFGEAIPGGYIGVDVFFVLSGFLISSILFREFESGTFSFKAFWERRIRRIFPPLIVLVLTVLVGGYFFQLPESYVETANTALAHVFFSANIQLYYATDYFADAANTKPLLHLWSLAVEEQFYLILPMLIWILNRYRVNKQFLILAMLAVASFCWSVYQVREDATGAYYLLPSRAWELLLGTLLAACKKPPAPSRVASEVVTWSGMAAILGSVFLLTTDSPFPGWNALPACLGTVGLLWGTGHPDSVLRKLLSLSPVVFIGKISYSLYLWHWSIFVFGIQFSLGEPTTGYTIGLLILSLVLSVFSYYAVETPFRKRSLFGDSKAIWTFGTIGSSLGAVAAFVVVINAGMPDRVSPETQSILESTAMSQRIWASDLAQLQNGEYFKLGVGKRSPIHEPVFLVFGDSHARSIIHVLDELSLEQEIQGIGAYVGACPPLVNAETFQHKDLARKANQAILETIDQHPSIQHVLLVGRWMLYTHQTNDTLLVNSRLPETREEQHELFVHHVELTLDAYNQRGITPTFLLQVPTHKQHVRQAIFRAWLLGIPLSDLEKDIRIDRNSFVQTNSRTLRYFNSIPSSRATFLDPSTYFYDEFGNGLIFVDGKSLYWDDDHISLVGAQRMVPMLREWLLAIKNSNAPHASP